MPKIKTKKGFRFIKELGGAVRRDAISKTATVLVERKLVRGRALDYGCGFGFDADHFGWESFDPYYRQKTPEGLFDTIICNHVAHMLTRDSRQELFVAIDNLLTPTGLAYISVTRCIPTIGKAGLRKRIQNYVTLSLPSVFRDDQMEVYRMAKNAVIDDTTTEFEDRM
jgi:hypothetical protein